MRGMEEKRLTYREYELKGDKLKAEGWAVVEVKMDYKIVILRR